MHPAAETTPTQMSPTRAHPSAARAILFVVVALLVGLRFTSEIAMMSQYGTDPQMGIWVMFLIVKLAFWLLTGGLLAGLLAVAWPKRWRSFAALALLLVWTVAICEASWRYLQARQALADASSPSTSSERLHELVHFEGIKAGYELDNRLASHSNTKAEDLRTLYQRDQLGTQMKLAANSKTPNDILEQLAEHKDVLVLRSLARNPELPESVLLKLENHPDKEIQSFLPKSDTVR